MLLGETSSAGTHSYPGLKVVALVGPSGTGKSHRASIVADRFGADAVLDDGLLIAGGKILAGSSAKRESTRAAAVRRALLEDPAHVEDIRQALIETAPSCLLVIGISRGMVGRVVRRLELPPPERILAIEEFASPHQMRKALRIRRSEGKHVIPAPTLEVRKSFAGYPVDPLRIFLKPRKGRGPGGGRPRGVFVEKSVVRPTWSALGRFYIEEAVLAAIAARAAVDTPGVGRVFQVKVDASSEGVSFDLSLGVVYGMAIQAVAAEASRRVVGAVEHMTALACRRVDIRVSGVVAPDRGRGGRGRAARGRAARGDASTRNAPAEVAAGVEPTSNGGINSPQGF